MFARLPKQADCKTKSLKFMLVLVDALASVFRMVASRFDRWAKVWLWTRDEDSIAARSGALEGAVPLTQFNAPSEVAGTIPNIAWKRFYNPLVWGAFMQSSRGVLFAQRLNELIAQFTELEDLQSRVAEAERRARPKSALLSKHPTSRRLRPFPFLRSK